MQVIEDDKRIYFLGDPHLGRPFVHGVPLARRGDREQMVWSDFLDRLHSPDCDLHICLGDLFDKWAVSYDLILNVASEYRKAAAGKPDTRFYMLKGNHDWVRDLERRSAFDVFAQLVGGIGNIIILDRPHTVGAIVFYPWHPLWDAREKLRDYQGRILIGHFDIEFGDHNQVPTTLGFERIYTGHDHKPRRLIRHGTEVIVVGSMQPYAHGEEINDDLYVTLHAGDVEGKDLRNKCVRLIGQYDGEIDCLQLAYRREASNDGLPNESVTLGDFDMDTLFAEAFAEAGVSDARTAEVLAQYHARRTATGG